MTRELAKDKQKNSAQIKAHQAVCNKQNVFSLDVLKAHSGSLPEHQKMHTPTKIE